MQTAEVKEYLKKVGENHYRIPRRDQMKVDVEVYLTEKLKKQIDDQSIYQLVQAASLPNLQGPVIGMPDLHQGYGLPIGGIMASKPEGIVSAGAVGMDINCGVRLLRTDIEARSLQRSEYKHCIEELQRRVPLGLGQESRYPELSRDHLTNILRSGQKQMIGLGFGREDDLEFTEEGGFLQGAEPAVLSAEAKKRANQLGTIGAGNHFIDFLKVEDVYERERFSQFGLYEGQLVVLIHTGSRGFGHQVCTEYSNLMAECAGDYGIDLPVKGLACCPVDSEEGQNYLAAMACAVNYAFANRQLITHEVRCAFQDLFSVPKDTIKLVYDVAHNIAKWEKYSGKRLLIHRKGATRALPAGHSDNPPSFKNTGHPALIPGSMGTRSYVVVGGERAKFTFHSVNHGAGRVMSRTAAKKQISKADYHQSIRGILVSTVNPKKVIDEAPQAYKDIDEVVQTLADIGITKRVAALQPIAVLNR